MGFRSGREQQRVWRSIVVGAIAAIGLLLIGGCGSDAPETERAVDGVVAEEADPAQATDVTPDEGEAEPAAQVDTDDSSDAEDASDAAAGSADEPAVDEQADSDPTESDSEEQEPAADGPTEPTVVELAEADWDGLVEWVLPAMGGITFGLPADHVVHHDGDMVIVRSAFERDAGRYQPSMIVALATTRGSRSGPPLDVADFTTTAIAGVGTAVPSNSTLELFGQQLEGWTFTIDDGLPDGPHYMFQAYPEGLDGPSAWQPFPHAELFLADVPDGVLAVGWIGRNDADLETARDIFERVAPTLELSEPIDSDRPAGTLPNFGPPVDPPEPVSVPDGWPGKLTGLSKPIEAGEYSSGSFETPARFTVPERWWVQPNFPGWVVLSADESFGPGDRGFEIRTGLNSLIAMNRLGPAADPVPFTGLRSLADSPPTNLEVIETEEVEAVGATGFRVRLEVNPDAQCIDGDPCAYLLTTKYPFPPASMRKGYVYELWQFDTDEPVVVVVSTPDADWFDVTTDVLRSFEFASG